jgi:hypothetical protein
MRDSPCAPDKPRACTLSPVCSLLHAAAGRIRHTHPAGINGSHHEGVDAPDGQRGAVTAIDVFLTIINAAYGWRSTK